MENHFFFDLTLFGMLYGKNGLQRQVLIGNGVYMVIIELKWSYKVVLNYILIIKCVNVSSLADEVVFQTSHLL